MKNLFRVFIALAMLSTLGLPMLAFAQDNSGGGMGAWDGCPVPENLPSDVSIGVVFGLSGSVAVYGESQQKGVELAVKEINDSAYLGEGVTLTAVFEDGGSDAEASIAAFDKLVSEQDVAGIIGPTLSTQAFGADPVATEAHTSRKNGAMSSS